MSGGPTPEAIVNALQGMGVTQGWDVVYALSARKVNELFQRQFVLNLSENDHLPPVTGTASVIEDYAVEFVDVVLGSPLIAFDPALDPQKALLTIPIVSGLVHITRSVARTVNVVSTQWIGAVDGYTITGTVPLGVVKGEVDTQTHITLRIDEGTGFVAGLGLPEAAGTALGMYFLGFLGDHAKGYRYSLGTLDYTPNGTDLVPVSGFEIATQKDLTDPADAGRVLLFIPTTYNPKGGTQTSLPLANVVPAKMDATLLLSSKVLFGDIVRPIVTERFGADCVAASGDRAGVWSVTTIGGWAMMGPLRRTSGANIYLSGPCGPGEKVEVKLAGITLAPSSGRLAARWAHDWPQPWSHQYFVGSTPLCDDGDVTMTISLDTAYEPSVNPVTAVISFAAQNGLDVSFPRSSLVDKLFNDGAARDTLAATVRDEVSGRLVDLLNLKIPHIGAFAVTNLLFPAQQASHLQSVHVPGDLVAFGTLKASGLSVTPPLATVTTAETLTLIADRPVTWSVPRGGGTIGKDGVYTPPKSVPGTRVIVMTATADKQQAYAAVVVVPAQVQVAPIIHVFEAGEKGQPFTAMMPGAGAKASWSLSPQVGAVDDKGVYRPPDELDEPVAVTLNAQIGQETGRARIVVFPVRPLAVQVTPHASAPLAPGAKQAFIATREGKPVKAEWSLLPDVGRIDQDGNYTAPENATAPQAVLVVARDPADPALGGTAVVLLVAADGAAIMRPDSDDPRTGRTEDAS